MTRPAPIWRMEARDVEGEPIIGPWETKAEAEQRADDARNDRFIPVAKAVRRR